MENNRPVFVKRIPERLNNREAKAFLREMEKVVNSDRPQLVFDCSTVKQIDAAGVEMLLHCLSRAVRHDGDLKLAAVSPQMEIVLQMTRTDRLFEIYDTATDAVLSFSRFLPSAVKRPSSVLKMPAPALAGDRPESELAA
ncbi:MAG: STAS domain-containing protein [Terriglobales bacterium]